jgi:hypothetical protein
MQSLRTPEKGIPAMFMLFCTLLLPAYSAIIGLVGFWVGRCARKLPIIDDNLPWTLSRSQIPASTEDSAKPGTGPARWPRGALRRSVAADAPAIRQAWCTQRQVDPYSRQRKPNIRPPSPNNLADDRAEGSLMPNSGRYVFA